MEHTITVTLARHAWPEKEGFTIHRPRGLRQYTFLHFFDSVQLRIGDKVINTLPDSCILFDINTPQWFCSPTPLHHDWIHMTGDVPGAMAAAGMEMDRVYTPGNAKFITAITREIEFEVLTKPAGHEKLLELKLRELLLKLSRSCTESSAGIPVKPAMAAQLRQMRSQVFSQLERPWTVADMAALAYISPSRFHAVYRQLFGISPTEDLIRARVDTARTRLCNSRESLSELAEALGYRNVTHFCRQFKQFTGLTPGEFRSSQQG